MATTEHATNAQMAAIMGWTFTYGEWLTADGNPTGYTNIPGRYDYFDPQHNLNHATLVEARLAELGLDQEYMSTIASILRMEDKGFSYWRMFTASAQTRCDAAWATWQQYQEQAR